MMYAYSVSTKRSVVVALVALAVVMSGQRAHAQPGWVLSHQKISDAEGRFTGIVDDDDFFGFSAASLGDLDGDGMGDLAVGHGWIKTGACGTARFGCYSSTPTAPPTPTRKSANRRVGLIEADA